MTQEIAMNQDLRELDRTELDAVSGGNILSPIANAVVAGVKAATDWISRNRPFPIQVDLSGAANAGKQLGEMLGGKPPA
jgi:hypothetical protein